MQKPEGRAASGLRPSVDVLDRLGDGWIRYGLAPLIAVAVILAAILAVAVEVYDTIHDAWRHRRRMRG